MPAARRADPGPEADPTGETCCFERGARKDGGGAGWADVWKRHCFAWAYKGRHTNLDRAFDQLRQYALALENPPLLIVSDMACFRVRTNWTNAVSVTHEFTLEELADAAVRDKLKWAMSDPERLRPDESRRALTERAATTFAELVQALRERGHEAQAVAHFVNRLVSGHETLCALRAPLCYVPRRWGQAPSSHRHPRRRGAAPHLPAHADIPRGHP